MRRLNALSTAALAVASAFVLLSAGCGSQAASSVAPTGVPVSGAGANIEGTVDTGSSSSGKALGSSGVTASRASGIRVSVVGTGLQTSTDGSGHFVLSGISGGAVTLHFEGSGIDAQLQISGLVAGQTLQIEVSVNGSHATLGSHHDDPSPSPSPSPSPNDENELEVRGAIESIGSGSLVVDGRTVIVTTATRIEGDHHTTLTFGDLVVGDNVEVEGMLQTDGTVLAQKIKLENENDNHGHELNFTGLVTSISLPSLVIASHNVLTDANTKVTGSGGHLSVASITVGETVDVKGSLLSDGSVLARQLKIRNGNGNEGDDDNGDDDGGDDDGGDDGGDDNSGSN